MKKTSTFGFTLVEILLYMGLASTLVLAVLLFLFVLLQADIKNKAIAEVEQQGMLALHSITRVARNAQAITFPAQGAQASSANLDVFDASKDPTVFESAAGILQTTEGGKAPLALTNNRVHVTGISFSNLSTTSTPGTLRIQLTISHMNPDGRNEYAVTRTFTGSATLHWP